MLRGKDDGVVRCSLSSNDVGAAFNVVRLGEWQCEKKVSNSVGWIGVELGWV